MRLRRRTAFRIHCDATNLCVYIHQGIAVPQLTSDKTRLVSLGGTLSIGVPNLLDQQRIGGEIFDDILRLDRVFKLQLPEMPPDRGYDARVTAHGKDVVPRFRLSADKASIARLARRFGTIACSREE